MVAERSVAIIARACMYMAGSLDCSMRLDAGSCVVRNAWYHGAGDNVLLVCSAFVR